MNSTEALRTLEKYAMDWASELDHSPRGEAIRAEVAEAAAVLRAFCEAAQTLTEAAETLVGCLDAEPAREVVYVQDRGIMGAARQQENP